MGLPPVQSPVPGVKRKRAAIPCPPTARTPEARNWDNRTGGPRSPHHRRAEPAPPLGDQRGHGRRHSLPASASRSRRPGPEGPRCAKHESLQCPGWGRSRPRRLSPTPGRASSPPPLHCPAASLPGAPITARSGQAAADPPGRPGDAALVPAPCPERLQGPGLGIHAAALLRGACRSGREVVIDSCWAS
ncbi:basic salivary proline-rich protein 1-like [Manis pentadactyla]|uniref:basic salivary proline-rich protein 1-like n=1 Tax=Manis pentadactyla TaxID=143292 RepID=UPI00255C2EA8|nr:basic salivary proline-rich protein 1-like [Manis pentadactyla]